MHGGDGKYEVSTDDGMVAYQKEQFNGNLDFGKLFLGAFTDIAKGDIALSRVHGKNPPVDDGADL